MSTDSTEGDGQPSSTRRKALRQIAGSVGTGAAVLGAASGSASAGEDLNQPWGTYYEHESGWMKIKGWYTEDDVGVCAYMGGRKLKCFGYDPNQVSKKKCKEFHDGCGNAVNTCWTVSIDYKGNGCWEIGGHMGYDWGGAWGSGGASESEQVCA